MCGITGFVDIRQSKKSYDSKRIIEYMTDVLKSRGPDDKGIWIDEKDNICLGHRRLSIIELSNLGKQPMTSHNNRFVIIYNGEIYNFLNIKKELEQENINFSGNSDTEVLIEAFSNWGIKKTLSKISGMFAFVVWDKKLKELSLARDRFGIKPLYYSFLDGIFFFGSQTKSFLKHPCWKNEISLDALGSFFRLGYIPSHQSIFKNTSQVLPGHYLVFSKNRKVKQIRYWDLKKIINSKKNKQNENNNIQDQTEIILNNSIKEHMISDVPIGCFLSGGIDSSLIAALMQKNSLKKIKTFNIGFQDKALDESKYAKQVAKCINSDHHNVIFSNQNIIDLVPKLNTIYDEPFADSSQLPTTLLSLITKEKVKVALSGDGGDELFGGYNRYNWAKKIKFFYSLPHSIRIIFAKSLKFISPLQWDNILSKLPFFKNYSFPGDKVYKLSEVIQLQNFSNVYSYLISQWQKKDIPLNKKVQLNEIFTLNEKSFLDLTEQMQLMDINNYLPDDILTKVDRASMSCGLEVRVPYLEKNLVEFMWSVNSKEKNSKKILKNILYKYVPKNLLERPKMGFSVPLEKWLKSSLKDWASDLLQKKELENNNINSRIVIKKWEEHLSGKRNWQYQLWPILIYQSWKKSLNAFN